MLWNHTWPGEGFRSGLGAGRTGPVAQVLGAIPATNVPNPLATDGVGLPTVSGWREAPRRARR